jgi:hypothetical protein
MDPAVWAIAGWGPGPPLKEESERGVGLVWPDSDGCSAGLNRYADAAARNRADFLRHITSSTTVVSTTGLQEVPRRD